MKNTRIIPNLYIVITIIFIIFLIFYNSTKDLEYFGSGPAIFNEEGYGERGNYYNNIRLEPLYNKFYLPTVFDK